MILKFDGRVVMNSSDLPRIVAAVKPGSKAVVELWRKGAAKQLTVVVAKMPEDGMLAEAAGSQENEAGTMIARLGIALSEPSREQLSDLQINGGLLVEAVKGQAARTAGLQHGDVLLVIGNMPLRSLNQLIEIIKQVPKGRNVALLVRRGDNAFYVAIKLDEK